jgi:hypothetical protein
MFALRHLESLKILLGQLVLARSISINSCYLSTLLILTIKRALPGLMPWLMTDVTQLLSRILLMLLN